MPGPRILLWVNEAEVYRDALARMPRLSWIQAMTAAVEDWLVRDDLRPGLTLTCARGVHRVSMPENILAALFALTKPLVDRALDQRDRFRHPARADHRELERGRLERDLAPDRAEAEDTERLARERLGDASRPPARWMGSRACTLPRRPTRSWRAPITSCS